MKVRFISGPYDGEDVEIGNNLLEMIDVYEGADGRPGDPFEIVSPNNGLWTYSKASLSNGDIFYVGVRQQNPGGTTLEPLTWTRVGTSLEVYNPTEEAVEVVASKTAVILPGDGYRVRIV